MSLSSGCMICAKPCPIWSCRELCVSFVPLFVHYCILRDIFKCFSHCLSLLILIRYYIRIQSRDNKWEVSNENWLGRRMTNTNEQSTKLILPKRGCKYNQRPQNIQVTHNATINYYLHCRRKGYGNLHKYNQRISIYRLRPERKERQCEIRSIAWWDWE